MAKLSFNQVFELGAIHARFMEIWTKTTWGKMKKRLVTVNDRNQMVWIRELKEKRWQLIYIRDLPRCANQALREALKARSIYPWPTDTDESSILSRRGYKAMHPEDPQNYGPVASRYIPEPIDDDTSCDECDECECEDEV